MKIFIARVLRFILRIKFLRKYFYPIQKKWLFQRQYFKNIVLQVNYRKGIKLNLDLNDWLQQNLFLYNAYEEKEISFVEHFLQPGDVFVDIGANIGLFSLVASRHVGENGSIFSFEPFSKNYKKFCDHLELNKCHNVKAEKLGISDKGGSFDIFYNEENNNVGGVSAFAKGNETKETVQSVTLDHYFEQHPVKTIKLIKIDIEGSEFMALKGMQHILKTLRPTLLVEVSEGVMQHTSHTAKDLEDFILSFGYKKYYLDKKGHKLEQRLPKDRSCNYVFEPL